MKRTVFLLLIMGLFGSITSYAEEAGTAPPAKEATPSAASASATTPAVAVAPPAVTPAVAVPPPASTPAKPAAAENANTDNLEFISGEVGELDEAGKTITVKLYGETESTATNKTLKVSVDASTDITDGEQDRALKSLTVGTEVDVEYDPATNKATYIFVY